MKSPRCRAIGGPASCKDQRCPQKRFAWTQDVNYVQKTLFNSTWSEKAMDSTLKLMEDLREKYGYPTVGTSRAVYNMGNGRVVKLAFNDRGINASMAESYAYDRSLRHEPFIPVAECAFVDYGNRYLLEMEWVQPLTTIDYKKLPDWVGYVDCAQVGYNKAGKLVAYDL